MGRKAGKANTFTLEGGRGSGRHITVAGERVAEQYDPAQKLLGNPAPGRSALDRRRQAADVNDATPPSAFRVDWSKISAAGGSAAPNLEGDDDEEVEVTQDR